MTAYLLPLTIFLCSKKFSKLFLKFSLSILKYAAARKNVLDLPTSTNSDLKVAVQKGTLCCGQHEVTF